MTTSDELTLVTVNLTADAMSTLNAAAERAGMSRTDIINRAVNLYGVIVSAPTGRQVDVGFGDGSDIQIAVLGRTAGAVS